MQEIKDIPVSEAVCEKLTSKYEQLYALFHVSIRVDSMYMKQTTDTFMLADSWPSDVFVKRFFKAKMDHSNLALRSFNCRSVRSSVDEVYSLCQKYDLVFLQEHWLLPHDLNFMSSIHPNFLAFVHSLVGTFSGILVGRPYGGTGILYRKSLSSCIAPTDTLDGWLTVIIFQSRLGPILLISVYMPTDYRDSDCLENYLEACTKIKALYDDSDAIHLFMLAI